MRAFCNAKLSTMFEKSSSLVRSFSIESIAKSLSRSCDMVLRRYYDLPPAMPAAGHSVLPLKFRSLFSPPNLRGRLADRHQTLLAYMFDGDPDL